MKKQAAKKPAPRGRAAGRPAARKRPAAAKQRAAAAEKTEYVLGPFGGMISIEEYDLLMGKKPG